MSPFKYLEWALLGSLFLLLFSLTRAILQTFYSPAEFLE